MKKKYLAYAILPAMAMALVGAGTVSAHFGMGFGGGNATPEQIAQSHDEMFKKQAELLGISIDEIKNAWSEGKNLMEIAQEKGITEEQMQTKLAELRKTQMQTHLKTLVEKGIITQAQADSRLKVMEERIKNGESGKGFGRHGKRMMGMVGPSW